MEIVSQTILVRLADMLGEGPSAISLNQIKMWVVPQMGEHDHDYILNQNYFETLLSEIIRDLIAEGYIVSSLHDGIEDGDAQMFSLTTKGTRYVEDLAAAIIEQ